MTSRDLRLEGEWELVEKKSTIRQEEGEEFFEIEEDFEKGDLEISVDQAFYEEDPVTGEETLETDSYSYDEEYEYLITFELDGTYKTEYNRWDEDGDKYLDGSSEGFWTFLKKNKAQDLEKHEAFTLAEEESEETDYDDEGGVFSMTEYSNQKSTTSPVYYLDRLTQNEMIIKTDYTYEEGDYTYTIVSTETYKKKN